MFVLHNEKERPTICFQLYAAVNTWPGRDSLYVFCYFLMQLCLSACNSVGWRFIYLFSSFCHSLQTRMHSDVGAWWGKIRRSIKVYMRVETVVFLCFYKVPLTLGKSWRACTPLILHYSFYTGKPLYKCVLIRTFVCLSACVSMRATML